MRQLPIDPTTPSGLLLPHPVAPAGSGTSGENMTGQGSCGYKRPKGQCGYHQHDKQGQMQNPCQRAEWKRTRRCMGHQSSGGGKR